MTNAAWDGSTGSGGGPDPFEGLPPAPAAPSAPAQPPVATDPRETPQAPPAQGAPTHVGHSNGGGEDSSLAQLRERMEAAAAAEEAEDGEWIREIPKRGLRIVCDAEIGNTTFRKWMRAAQPKSKRRSGQPADPADNDQLIMSEHALCETNVRIEMDHAFGSGRDPEWRPLLSRIDQEPLTLRSDELLRSWGVVSRLALLQKLWAPKADPRIIDAGMALLDAAGFAGGLDDDPEG